MRLRGRWRAPMVFREAVLNVSALGSRGFLVSCLGLIAGGLLANQYALSVYAFEDRLADDGRIGARIVELAPLERSDERAAISGASCERLSRLPAVARSGSIVPGGRLDSIQLGASVPWVYVSGALLTDVPGVAVVGRDILPDISELDPRSRLRTSMGTMPFVLGTSEPEGVDVGSSLSLPMPPTSAVPSCLAELVPGTPVGAASAVLLAALDTQGGSFFARPHSVVSSSAEVAFLNRPDRHLPLLLGGVLGLVAYLARRLRSGEVAAYRLSGTGDGDFLFLALIEDSLAVFAMVMAGFWTLQVADLPGSLMGAALVGLLSAGACWITISTIGSIQLSRANALSLAKDQ